MGFTDELVFYLFTLAFAAFTLAYLMTDAYFAYREDKMDIKNSLNSLSIPIMLIGAYLLVVGVVSQFTWFLPGAYDILFFDPIVAFGLVLVAGAVAIRYNVKLRYVGFLSLLFGAMAIWYGISGYNLGLTKAPLEFLALFTLFGAAGIMTFPATLIVDNFPRRKLEMPMSWNTALAILWILLILAGIAAAAIGAIALPAHLATPP
ncbi:MAG: DUF981 domain-containing protein [Candidatus Parvarchaeota archaeon]|jgi:Predicted membrane protein|nr:DUF981 domain-containing protein [Candidatus Parvarchaeota archaeon]MCL5100992.1 DUF981 domain-containing protein [Candidatus Parvarchaeota archaeon]